MRLVTESGLWSTAARPAPVPATALLEVSGAVLSWPVDDPAAAPQITFTDVRRADWLWRVLGESGHNAVVTALDGAARSAGPNLEIAGVELIGGSVDPLRALALGHWLRRWWPASARAGIPALDAALLDAEIALRTVAAQDYFTDDTPDSDVGELLAPHPVALTAHALGGDPRVVGLARACGELASDIGLEGAGWARLEAALDQLPPPGADVSAGRRDDYALAAGTDGGRGGVGAIADGVDSLRWTTVAPGIFDAAEDTVHWTVETRGGLAVAIVTVAVGGTQSASGVVVSLRTGDISGTGVLDAGGRALLPLLDAGRLPVTESVAWDRDWASTRVTVGDDVQSDESPEIRERIRRFARDRLQQPAQDAYLAEILAAEWDY
ncbi:hypothetical protein [Mycolicibacterium komossense]|uniref:Uncharacterized protein n=1 Tax=Mycolicibacterium komossense TaxID=1779 RepID=A0ABT3CA63_9MYCO|nr:hypothetical protein [Mycolicibacterium komossense]MCV7226352.1 hypothetical protein [Mycolicibacterium komossense]